jgi:hypothetical protein
MRTNDVLSQLPSCRSVWAYCPTLSTATPSFFCAGIPSRNAAKMPGVGGDHGHGDSSLRAESVQKWSDFVLLLSPVEIRPNKLSRPVCSLISQEDCGNFDNMRIVMRDKKDAVPANTFPIPPLPLTAS